MKPIVPSCRCVKPLGKPPLYTAHAYVSKAHVCPAFPLGVHLLVASNRPRMKASPRSHSLHPSCSLTAAYSSVSSKCAMHGMRTPLGQNKKQWSCCSFFWVQQYSTADGIKILAGLCLTEPLRHTGVALQLQTRVIVA